MHIFKKKVTVQDNLCSTAGCRTLEEGTGKGRSFLRLLLGALTPAQLIVHRVGGSEGF